MCRSRGRHSALLLANGSDVRPGVGWAPALDVQISWQAQYFVNLRVQISWQAQHFAACQGVGCTPWRRLGTGAGCADFVAGAARCEPSCADFVAGAVLCEPPCADLVAGTALCCLPRGRMYALASAGHRRWMCRFQQAQHFVNLHVQISWQAQAVLCEPPCADLVAGTALCCLPRGRMYALASAGRRRWMCRFRGRRSAL